MKRTEKESENSFSEKGEKRNSGSLATAKKKSIEIENKREKLNKTPKTGEGEIKGAT